ncbi:hypothetical protein QLX08_008724 [Tetragonisca angustula]|uniref:Uncharacterized protein n=1 Tax=Tetragonisca angustula TaxID=166442 RepID=A0AAW0ZJS1_9HYME
MNETSRRQAKKYDGRTERITVSRLYKNVSVYETMSENFKDQTKHGHIWNYSERAAARNLGRRATQTGAEPRGKAALIPFNQSETVFNDHVPSLPLFAFSHSSLLLPSSLPPFLLLLFMWSKFLKPSLTLGFLRTTRLKTSLWIY